MLSTLLISLPGSFLGGMLDLNILLPNVISYRLPIPHSRNFVHFRPLLNYVFIWCTKFYNNLKRPHFAIRIFYELRQYERKCIP